MSDRSQRDRRDLETDNQQELVEDLLNDYWEGSSGAGT